MVAWHPSRRIQAISPISECRCFSCRFAISYNYAPLFSEEPPLRAVWTFFVARFARLYPLYIFALVALGIEFIPSPHFADNELVLLSYLTMTQSWFNVEMATFPPFWSISTEWFFYFVFAIGALLMPANPRPLATFAVFAAVGLVGTGVIFQFFGPQAASLARQCCFYGTNVSADPLGWLTYFSPYVRLLDFIIGILAARTYAALQQSDRRSRYATVVLSLCVGWCAAVILIVPLTELPFLKVLLPNFILAPALAVLMLVCCRNDTWLTRMLSSPPLILAGTISYSVYIWSWAIMRLLGNEFAPTEPSPLAYLNSGVSSVVCILLTTVFAYGSYLLIEKPSRAWLRRMLSPGRLALLPAV